MVISTRPFIRSIILATTLILGAGAIYQTSAQAQEPLDGPGRIFKDHLLDNLTGKWQLTRTIRGTQVDELKRGS
jgi:hypothetical protein